MIPEDCQLQDLFLCLHAISKFSVIVHGCLDCFPQLLNLHIFMCWCSSATYLLICSGWAEAQIPHPKFTFQPQPSNRMAQPVIASKPKKFYLTLWEVVWVPTMYVTEAVKQFQLWYYSPEDFQICIWQFCSWKYSWSLVKYHYFGKAGSKRASLTLHL